MSTTVLSSTRVVAPAARLRGELRVPGDKSITHRALLLGAMARGTSRFGRPGIGADTRATAAVIEAVGVPFELSGAELVVHGPGLEAWREPDDVLNCMNSGTTMRLCAGVLAARPFHCVLTGDASLRRRPMDRVVQPLRTLGADIRARANGRLAPLALAPAALHGAAMDVEVASAQVKSAILLAAVQASGPTEVRQPAASRDHTERMLRGQGAHLVTSATAVRIEPCPRLGPLEMDIPGDISSAAFWITAAALHPDAEVVVRGVGLNPTRTGLLDVLRAMGARVDVQVERQTPEPMGTVTVRSSNLRATTIGGEVIPRLIDEVPLVALLATKAAGTTRVTDAQELAVKESDRLTVTAAILGALGGEVEATPDGFQIAGGAGTGAGEVDAAGDHRMAMLAAVAGVSGAGQVTIRGAQAVDVSYPTFWDDLAALAG
ncbi:MAG: 3-phosphoshikimate 1-carboxyvinyltransferase [Actinobacteria bacterium]|nr:3-phosphoshikimate 1-carboxyvinyltransferase [Actinomycetota bacterium]